eukprot:10896276-Karenia_brevis.AAC.1
MRTSQLLSKLCDAAMERCRFQGQGELWIATATGSMQLSLSENLDFYGLGEDAVFTLFPA